MIYLANTFVSSVFPAEACETIGGEACKFVMLRCTLKSISNLGLSATRPRLLRSWWIENIWNTIVRKRKIIASPLVVLRISICNIKKKKKKKDLNLKSEWVAIVCSIIFAECFWQRLVTILEENSARLSIRQESTRTWNAGLYLIIDAFPSV